MMHILRKASRLWVSGCKQRPGKEKYEMSWVAQQNKVTTQMSWRHHSRWGWGGWKRWMGLGHLSILYSLPISTLFLIHNNTLFEFLPLDVTFKIYLFCIVCIIPKYLLYYSALNERSSDFTLLYTFWFDLLLE